jgi:hypothetical protein
MHLTCGRRPQFSLNDLQYVEPAPTSGDDFLELQSFLMRKSTLPASRLCRPPDQTTSTGRPEAADSRAAIRTLARRSVSSSSTGRRRVRHISTKAAIVPA